MIEVASSPANLAEWDPAGQAFYLEVFGETSPLMNLRFAEALPAASPDGTPQPIASAPIYEYWWTMGHPGLPQETGHLWDHPLHDSRLWQQLQDPAARVYLYFPITGGWRIKELTTTVKYLTPPASHAHWWEKVTGDLKSVAPLIDDAGKMMTMVPLGGFGAAPILHAIAKMQIDSVPQTPGYQWTVSKVTYGAPTGIHQGIMWTLPKTIVAELGPRLTGSVAVSFIPSQPQGNGSGGKPAVTAQPLLANAVVYGPDGPIWVPGPRDFIELMLSPVVQDG